MKANPRRRATTTLVIIGLAVSLPLSGCVPPAPGGSGPGVPPSRSPARPAPSTTAPLPAPAPAPTPAADWRDLPQAPGRWTYGTNGTTSGATFADGRFVIQCDAARTVTLLVGGPARTGSVGIAVSTSAGNRALSGTGTARGVAVTLPARDPVLDAMAFSRGRFVLSVNGGPTLSIPSWTEVSKVIEDCR